MQPLFMGPPKKTPITTDPSESNLTLVEQNTKFTTPCEVELNRKSDHILKFDKEGFDPATVEVKYVVSGARNTRAPLPATPPRAAVNTFAGITRLSGHNIAGRSQAD